MNPQEELNQLYNQSHGKDDDLQALLKHLSDYVGVLGTMTEDYIRSGIKYYLEEHGKGAETASILRLAPLVPGIFMKSFLKALHELQLECETESDGNISARKRSAIDWAKESHSDIYQDWVAERREIDAEANSPAVQESLDAARLNALKKMKGQG